MLGGRKGSRKSSRTSGFAKVGFRNSVFESAATLREGYLMKKSSGPIRRWQRRYFVLQGHYLKYCVNEEEKNAQEEIKGVVDMSVARVVSYRNVADLEQATATIEAAISAHGHCLLRIRLPKNAGCCRSR